MVVNIEEYRAQKHGSTAGARKKKFLELQFTDVNGKGQKRSFKSAMEFIQAVSADTPDLPVDAPVSWARFQENDDNQWTNTTVAELALRCKMVMGC